MVFPDANPWVSLCSLFCLVANPWVSLSSLFISSGLRPLSIHCVLCSSNIEETAYHLFFGCPFSKECWQMIGLQWNSLLPFYDMMSASKISFHKQFFMEVFIISTWCIWKQRNGFVFDNRPPTIDNWKSNFIDECFLQAHRFSQTLKTPFLEWVNSKI